MPDVNSEGTRSRWRWLSANGILCAMLFVFAFLAASSPVRNSDFWRHLAVGRLIAQGNYKFGEDPLAYTTQGTYWANHSWLFDLGAYLGFVHLGGGAMAVAKAIVVTLLAAILAACNRRGEGIGVSLLATALAVVAMSPRLLFHSALMSMLMLAATIALLSAERRRYWVWLLPLLFALWVNLDGWFFLGPLVATLFWLGERISKPVGEQKLSSWLPAAALVACLASPHHFRSFVLPAEISPALLGSSLVHEPRFDRFFQPIWRGDLELFRQSTPNLSAFGYGMLLFVGAASFVVCRRALFDGRFLTFSIMAALSFWNLRLVPFFAVAAAPILSLNLQDAVRQWRQPAAAPQRRSVGGRFVVFVASVAAGIGLIAAAWLGGLQGRIGIKRQVAWEVQPDPGLRRSAELRSRWRQDGFLTQRDRVFHTSPDAAHYAAWFSPGERCFLDLRLSLFAGVADEYVGICRELGFQSEDRNERPLRASSWLDRHSEVSVVVVGDRDAARIRPALSRLWARDSEFALLDLSGLEATFGRRSVSRHGVPFDQWRLDGDRIAFSPNEAEHQTWRISSPESLRVESKWWTPLLAPPSTRAAEVDSTLLLLHWIDDEKKARAPVMHRARIAAFAAGLMAEAGMSEDTGRSAMLVWKLENAGLVLPALDQVPPGWCLLALRAARKAVQATPQDPDAYLRLGQAYLALSYETREFGWASQFRPLAQLRHVQTVCALERAVALDSDLLPAHELLVRVYSARGMLDAALFHMNEQLRIEMKRKAAGLRGGDKLDSLRRQVTDLQTVVQDRRNELVLRSQGLGSNPFARASIAVRLGLARSALDDILLASNVILFGLDGARLETELLLMLGRPDRVRTEMDDPRFFDSRDRLGWMELPGNGLPGHPPLYYFPAYAWSRLLLEAADGDFRKAQEHALEIAGQMNQERMEREQLSRQIRTIGAVTQLGLAARSDTRVLTEPLFGEDATVSRTRDALSRTYIQVQADMYCLTGVLMLEEGRVEAAEALFKKALTTVGTSRFASSGFPGEIVSRAYLARIAAQRPKSN